VSKPKGKMLLRPFGSLWPASTVPLALVSPRCPPVCLATGWLAPYTTTVSEWEKPGKIRAPSADAISRTAL
jgi:hypothetical protein